MQTDYGNRRSGIRSLFACDLAMRCWALARRPARILRRQPRQMRGARTIII
ncbi:hypothetical protein SAMN05216176_109191 [Nitratireductor indicus]|nr:hypothetical protein SAMN05216176_109191 [Nitratireductor indicus]